MHSFTSSSNDRLPILNWRKIIVLLSIALIGFFTGWNLFWMNHGYRIQPKDDSELWSYQRRRVSSAGKNAVVFLGSSRMRSGIDLDEVRKISGKKPFQLAIAGGSPLPVLEDLAADESFNGTVIVEITEYVLHREFENSMVAEWVKDYRETSADLDYIFPVKSFAQSLIIFPEIGLTMPQVSENVFTGKLFDKKFLKQVELMAPNANTFERSWQGYHDKMTADQIEQRRQTSIYAIKQAIEWRKPETAKFIAVAERIKSSTKRIESRGGTVILINFPLNGEIKDLNEKYFPKKDFWDVLVRESAVKTIDYADFPPLASIETLDNTHLDGRNATIFTRELFKIIEAK